MNHNSSSSEKEIIDEEQKQQQKQKRNEYMKRYRSKRTDAFIECTKRANKTYYEKNKEMVLKYKDLIDNGFIETIQQSDLNRTN